jgi:hypothetical protein
MSCNAVVNVKRELVFVTHEARHRDNKRWWRIRGDTEKEIAITHPWLRGDSLLEKNFSLSLNFLVLCFSCLSLEFSISHISLYRLGNLTLILSSGNSVSPQLVSELQSTLTLLSRCLRRLTLSSWRKGRDVMNEPTQSCSNLVSWEIDAGSYFDFSVETSWSYCLREQPFPTPDLFTGLFLAVSTRMDRHLEFLQGCHCLF